MHVATIVSMPGNSTYPLFKPWEAQPAGTYQGKNRRIEIKPDGTLVEYRYVQGKAPEEYPVFRPELHATIPGHYRKHEDEQVPSIIVDTEHHYKPMEIQHPIATKVQPTEFSIEILEQQRRTPSLHSEGSDSDSEKRESPQSPDSDNDSTGSASSDDSMKLRALMAHFKEKMLNSRE